MLGVVAAAVLAQGSGHGNALNCNANDAWQDRFPSWSPNGNAIAFARQQPGCDPPAESLGFVTPGEPERIYGNDVRRGSWAAPTWAPNALVVAYSRQFDSLGVTAPDGPVGNDGSGDFPSWAGDEIAFTIENEVRVLHLPDGSRRTVLTDYVKPTQSSGVPVWSPDRTRLALGDAGGIAVINADGSGSRVIAVGQNQSVNPAWSPDGQRIAFESNRDGDFEVYSIGVDGSGLRNLTNAPQAEDRMPAWHGHTIAFISNRDRDPRTVYGYSLYTMNDDGGAATRSVRDVHPNSQISWSPDGSKIAYSAGRECKRWGIYVYDLVLGEDHRVTNPCRFEGTDRADTIHGSPFLDFLIGEGGNDRLYGHAGPDDLRGAAGNDRLYGGAGDDVLVGGVGHNVVYGGPGSDRFITSPERGSGDRVYGGGGNDVVIATSGNVDVISCGSGRDSVRADKRDRVARDCERVLRR